MHSELPFSPRLFARYVKASFMTANYQPACSGLENECGLGVNLHLNIWCPDNKISHHHAHNAIKKIIILFNINSDKTINLSGEEKRFKVTK